MVDHPLELPAMRADGSEFPAEIGITRPQLSGPPLFTGHIRDITQRRRDEQELRDLAAEQAALRRVAVVVAGEHDPQRVFAVATEEVARLLGAATSNMVRFEDDGTATVEGALERARRRRRSRPGRRLSLDSPTAAARIRATGRPARVEDFSTMAGTDAARLRRFGFTAAVGAPIALSGQALGRGDGLDAPSRRRSRPTPSSGSPTSPSWSRWPSPTPRRARSSRRRAPGSSRRATTSAAGSSATSTTAPSSGSSRWR